MGGGAEAGLRSWMACSVARARASARGPRARAPLRRRSRAAPPAPRLRPPAPQLWDSALSGVNPCKATLSWSQNPPMAMMENAVSGRA
jgi:hypothetical protein